MDHFLLVIFFYFLSCSFLGWIVESGFRSMIEKRIVNSGFLSGPIIPIYGFGAVLIYILSLMISTLLPFWILIIISMIIPAILEYITSFLMEKILSIKLWDYSGEKLNIKGRICLKFSLIWAVLTLITVFFIQPLFIGWFNAWKDSTIYFMGGMGVMYLATDIYYSGKLYFNYVEVLKKIREKVVIPQFKLIIGNMSGRDIPSELKRFLKPLKTFSFLRKEINANMQVFPAQFINLLKRTIDPYFTKEGRSDKK